MVLKPNHDLPFRRRLGNQLFLIRQFSPALEDSMSYLLPSPPLYLLYPLWKLDFVATTFVAVVNFKRKYLPHIDRIDLICTCNGDVAKTM